MFDQVVWHLTNIWIVKIVKITFIVDHISPHTGYACLQPSRGLDALWPGSQSLCRTIQCLTKAIQADSLYNEIEYGKIEEEEERRPRNFQACLSLTRLVQIWICRALRDPQEQWDPLNHLDESQQVAQVQKLTFARLQKAIRYLRLPFNWRPKHFRHSKCSFPN